MRRLTLSCCCCTALVLVGCARSDERTTDTAAGTAAATAASPTISPADVAGRWTMRSVPETGPDTTPTVTQLDLTADTANWTITLANRPPIKTRVVAIAGDSIVTETGPFESVRRPGVQVTTRTVMRLRDGKLVGNTVARYTTTGADSVLRLRAEATRTP